MNKIKVRTDFVTNSSSSSFIVQFNQVPNSAEELKIMLFKDKEIYDKSYSEGHYYTQEVAQTVFNDMKGGPAKIDDLIDEFSMSHSIPNFPKWEDYDDYDSYNFAATVFATDYIKNNIKDLSKIFIFNYADEDGPYFSALEHGNLFKNVKHIKISHH